MKAHRAARAIAFGTDGKLRVLAELLEKHYPVQTLVFTDDNATVYRISQEYLIPAITHQTPVKERHAILEKFKSGEYPTLVTSRVLNEGGGCPRSCDRDYLFRGLAPSGNQCNGWARVLRKGKTAKQTRHPL